MRLTVIVVVLVFMRMGLMGSRRRGRRTGRMGVWGGRLIAVFVRHDGGVKFLQGAFDGVAVRVLLARRDELVSSCCVLSYPKRKPFIFAFFLEG